MATKKKKKRIAPAKEAKETKQDTKSTPIQQDSPLLNLPSELRNMIYEEVLVPSDAVTIPSIGDCRFEEKNDWDGKVDDLMDPPALLQTCVQIRQEARSIYFGKNAFVMEYDAEDELESEYETGPSLARWLNAHDLQDFNAIKEICIIGDSQVRPRVANHVLRSMRDQLIPTRRAKADVRVVMYVMSKFAPGNRICCKKKRCRKIPWYEFDGESGLVEHRCNWVQLQALIEKERQVAHSL